jgi:hypothetical protein
MEQPLGSSIPRFLALASLGLSLIGAPARASADLQVVDPALTELKFGQGFEAIAKWVGKRLDKIYGPQIARAKDGNERARLKEAREREIGLMESGEVIFDGRHTGWEMSLVSSDVGVGTDESMYVFKDGAETHYFLMRRGKLWKYVRSLLAGPTFEGRVATYQRSLGKPAATRDESDGLGGRRLTSAQWSSGALDLRLVNRRTVYGTDVVILEDRAVAAELALARDKAKKPGLGGVTQSVESFLLDDPDTYGAPPPPPPDGTPTGPKPKPQRSPR